MKTSINDYEKQANDFLIKTNTKLSIKFLKYDRYFPGDKDCRNIYKITMRRKKDKTVKSYTFTFGQSLVNTATNKPPTSLRILSCLEKYDFANFEDFCAQLGYDQDSRTAEKVYKAVTKQFQALQRLFTDEELDILRKIQ